MLKRTPVITAAIVKIAVNPFSRDQPFKPINLANMLILGRMCESSQAKTGHDANACGTSRAFLQLNTALPTPWAIATASAHLSETRPLLNQAVLETALPSAAWAAANRAIGTRNGEQET